MTAAAGGTSIEPPLEVIGPVLSNGSTRNDKYKCHMSNCLEATFGRLADLKRHRGSRHGDMKKSYWCPVAGCERSLSSSRRAFPCKDKMFLHLSQKHSDIVTLGSE